MATIEDVKLKLIVAAGEARAVSLGAKGSAEASLERIGEALAMLDALPDPAELMKLVGADTDRRRGARVRAKLEASHGIRGMIETRAAAFVDQPTTWRDGYIRGLEDAHKHVQGIADDDGG